jgi:hypothetical protein
MYTPHRREVPRDRVLNFLIEMNVIEVPPKPNVLIYVLQGHIDVRLDFENQALLCMACLTLHFFLVEASKISGAVSVDFIPCSQGESQKDAILPLPMVIVVEA